MSDQYECDHCGKSFGTVNGVYQHTKTKHYGRKNRWHSMACTKNAHKANRQDRRAYAEPSMADRMIEAQLQYAMGGPVDEDYLLDSMDLD